MAVMWKGGFLGRGRGPVGEGGQERTLGDEHD
jgi:hypothetical protein